MDKILIEMESEILPFKRDRDLALSELEKARQQLKKQKGSFLRCIC